MGAGKLDWEVRITNMYEIRQAAIDYSDDEFMDVTSQELTRMTREEQALRNYARMEQHRDRCTDAERTHRLREYDAITDKLFEMQTPDIWTLRTDLTPQDPIQVRKRFRYFPQVPYRHNHFELLYVHAGHCRYVSPIQAQNLEHGDFCLVEYGVPHQILNHSDACILIELSIHREKLETLCASLLEEEHILTRYFKGALYGVASHPLVIFQTGGTQAVQYYLLAMLCEYQARLPHHSVMLEALLNALMVILITGCKSQEYHSAEAGPILDAIWSSLQEPDREVTLASIAQEFGYSPRQVNRILQNTYGRTFSGLLRKLRMEQAAKLLRESDLPISQIAAEVHCADASHLNKSFRQEYQLSPRQYREQNSQEIAKGGKQA